MPHIHLQTTPGTLEPELIPATLRALARKLASFETIDSKSVKAYHTKREVFAMGEGAPRGFIHCEVALLTGRPLELRQQIGEAFAAQLRGIFQEAISAGDAGLTIEIREMDRETYIR